MKDMNKDLDLNNMITLEMLASRGISMIHFIADAKNEYAINGTHIIQLSKLPIINDNVTCIYASGNTWEEAKDDLMTCPEEDLDKIGTPWGTT